MSELPSIPDAIEPSGPFPALKYPNYRKWFAGAIISVIGTWMTGVSLSWVLWTQTKDPLYLGLQSVCFQVPMALWMLPAGVLVDRVEKRRLIFITQSLLTLASTTLAILSFTGHLNVWTILVMSAVRGSIQGFDMPGRQAFVLEMVDRDVLHSAVALNSAIFNTGRVVGPMLAGYLLYAKGPTICFTVDALSFLAVLIALPLMRLPKSAVRPPRRVYRLHELKMGLTEAFFNPHIAMNLVLLALVSVFVFSYATLLPMFADRVYGGGSHTFGMLTSACGGGAVLGALAVSAFVRKNRLGTWMFAGTLLAGFGLLAFALAGNLYVGLVCLVVLGLAQLIHGSPSNTGIQLAVRDRYRGRVMSLFGLTFVSLSPLGSMFYGGLAKWYSPRAAIIVGSACALAAALTAGLRLMRMDKGTESEGSAAVTER